MKFIIKLFPEITIKSPPVRLRFIKILSSNIRNILKRHDDSLAVVRHWDHIHVTTKEPSRQPQLLDELIRIPGIHRILLVDEIPFTDLHDIFLHTLTCYGDSLPGKSFCVRVKRRGQHPFTSMDAERYIGGGLNQHIASARVKLTQPDITIHLEITDNKLLLIKESYPGAGGFPLGTQEDVLSLISGGFDSGVASYLLMRRGSRVHYCFFNLGGSAHEAGVRQVAYYLWQRYGSSHQVHFISVNFAPVVEEILQKIDDGQMGVVLKRMMIRAASQIAQRYGVQALVTGEALGQVSSQTLSNLRLIDNVSDTLILRPLIASDKPYIIDMAYQIGTGHYASTMPEYCAVISKSPTVKAIKARIEAEEAQFDFSLLEQVVQSAENLNIRQLAEQYSRQPTEVQAVQQIAAGQIVLDIRASDEQKNQPIQVPGGQVVPLPFYKLSAQFAQLDQNTCWLLWCDRGVMSRLQALSLLEQGYRNVKIYRGEVIKQTTTEDNSSADAANSLARNLPPVN